MKSKPLVIFLLAALPVLVSCTNRLPVRLTSHAGATSVGELTELAFQPVEGDRIYPASLIDMETDEIVQVNNAVDLYRYLDLGYLPNSGIDRVMAMNITSETGAYPLVRELEPSEATYVRALNFEDPDVLEWFPFAFHSVFASGYREADEAMLSGEYQRLVNPFNPVVRVVDSETYRVEFLNGEPGGEFRVWVELQAFGDWNGDGVEDLVLCITQRAEHGTMRDRFYSVMARDQDGRWEMLTRLDTM